MKAHRSAGHVAEQTQMPPAEIGFARRAGRIDRLVPEPRRLAIVGAMVGEPRLAMTAIASASRSSGDRRS